MDSTNRLAAIRECSEFFEIVARGIANGVVSSDNGSIRDSGRPAAPCGGMADRGIMKPWQRKATLMQLRFVGAALIWLSASVALGQPKSLVIGIDGLRPDALELANTPFIDSLINGSFGGGAFRTAYSGQAQSEDITVSGPNHSSMLTGVHRDRHGVTDNSYSGINFATYPEYFTRLEQARPEWNTVRLMTWTDGHNAMPSGADYRINGSDAGNTMQTSQLLAGTHPSISADPDAIYLFLDDVDIAGHSTGYCGERADCSGYFQEIEQVDGQIGQVLNAMSARPNFANEDWQIIITSDHGGNPDGGHGGGTPERRTIPFLVSGRNVAAGTPFPAPRNVDVAKTLFTHLGVDVPNIIDGHAVGVAPTAPPVVSLGANLVFNGDAEFDRAMTMPGPDQYASGWVDSDVGGMTVFRGGRPSNVFAGGQIAGSAMRQTIDIGDVSGQIDAGGLHYVLSGELGGVGSEADNMRLGATFFGASGEVLGVDQLAAVSAAERGNVTGALARQSSFGVPIGARRVQLELTAARVSGTTSDGFADNISLVLAEGAKPFPSRPQLQDGLVTYLQFENDYLDSSGRAHHAAIGAGSPQFIDGRFGRGVTIDGVAEHLTLGNPSDLQFGAGTDFTVAFWVRSIGNQVGDPALISNKNWDAGGNPGWAIAFENNGNDIQVNVGDGARRADIDDLETTSGLWEFVAVTFDRDGAMTLFTDPNNDGILDSLGITAGQPSLATIGNLDTPLGFAVNIGSDGTGAYGSNLDADLDDLGIWRRALSRAEIEMLWSHGQGIELADLIASALIPGDVDGDGVVNRDDYLIWNEHVGFDNATGAGTLATLAMGDVDQDGDVDLNDFSMIHANVTAGNALPEPKASLLAGIGAIILGAAGRMRRRAI